MYNLIDFYLHCGLIATRVIGRKDKSAKLLKKLSKMNDFERLEYLMSSDSELFSTRDVKESDIELASSLVNSMIEFVKTHKCTKNLAWEYEISYKTLTKIFHAFDVKSQRAKSNLPKLVNKVLAMIPEIVKHHGYYDQTSYKELYHTYGVSHEDFPLDDITYIPTEVWKSICGEHSALDYEVVRGMFILLGVFKLVSDVYRFVPDTKKSRNNKGVCKPYYVDPEYFKRMTTHTGETVIVNCPGLYNHLQDKLRILGRKNRNKLSAVIDLLFLVPKEELIKAAEDRMQMPVSYLEDPEDAGCREPRRVMKMKVNANDEELTLTHYQAMTILAMRDHDLFTILSYSVDDYSERLHTLFTRVSKVSRKYFRWITDERVAEVDYQSCQPRLLIAVLVRYGFIEFAKIAGNHDVYESISLLLNNLPLEDANYKGFSSERDRGYMKFFCMKSIFGTGKEHTQLRRLLINQIEHCHTDEFIRRKRVKELKRLYATWSRGNMKVNFDEGMGIRGIHTKKGFYVQSSIPKRLQSAEVDIIFGKNGVVETLRRRGVRFITTIHDSVLVPEHDAELAKEVMESVAAERFKEATMAGLKFEAKITINK